MALKSRRKKTGKNSNDESVADEKPGEVNETEESTEDVGGDEVEENGDTEEDKRPEDGDDAKKVVEENSKDGADTEEDNETPEVDVDAVKDNQTPAVDADSEKDNQTPAVDADSEKDDQTPEVDADTEKDNQTPEVDADTEKDDQTPEVDADTDDHNAKGTNKKSKQKKNRKQKAVEENVDDGESLDEELPPKRGILDGPVTVLTEKRERKVEARYTNPELKKKDTEMPDYSKGKGVHIKDIPYIKLQISMTDEEDLDVLHRLMYQRKAKPYEIKKKIRSFCGYPFDEDSKNFKAVSLIANRLTMAGMKFINNILGLVVSKDREQMSTELMDFLKDPKDLGLPVPEIHKGKVQSKKAKKHTGNIPTKKKTSNRNAGKRKNYAEIEESEDDDDDEEDDDEEDDEEQDDEEEDDEDQEEEEEEEEVKSRRSSRKKGPVKKQPPKRKSNASKRQQEQESESSDDEPLVKKKKSQKGSPKKPPTNVDLKKFIAAILKDADLETVTMKGIIRQVNDQYSRYDLSAKKEYIKKTVKDML